jgi:hypothetical protein
MKVVRIAPAVLVALTAATASGGPPGTRDVTYVPSIVSVPADPVWGGPLRYVIEIRSRARLASKAAVGLLVYLSAPSGEATTAVGTYHRVLQVPADGVATLRFTTTAPARPTGRQVCLGVTVGGDSSGAFVCTPVG